MSQNGTSKSFDLVLHGATGFVGRLAAEYVLSTKNSSELRFAISGRNESKLRALQSDLRARFPRWPAVPYLLTDSLDPRSAGDLARSAHVVCSTVGPYSLYGTCLVEACASVGADYADINGEPPFVREMIDRYHDRAHSTGSRIVVCAGFDSLPSDLGTYALQKHLTDQTKSPAEEVKFLLRKMRGGISGGTIASMSTILSQATRPEVRRVLLDPYALNPEGERCGPDGKDQWTARYDPTLGEWTGPFIMATINTRIVRRTNALLGYPYGRNFRYSEVTGKGPGLRGALGAARAAATHGLTNGAFAMAPLRRILTRYLLPGPGDGPNETTVQGGCFEIELLGFSGGRRVGRTVVRGNQDPGYGSTACMLMETGLSLLDGRKGTSSHMAGVLTPASAVGDSLLQRLRDGLVEVVVDTPVDTHG